MFATPSIAPPSSEDSQTGTAARAEKPKRRKGKASTASAEDENSRGGQGKRKRAHNACTTCRQQKLRCDGPIKFPAPCSRCVDQGLSCRVDPTFKRTPARQRLEQVSRQLEYMRERLELRSAQPVEGVPALEQEAKSEDDSPAAPVFPVLDPALLPMEIEDIELTPSGIVALFEEFHLHYHPHFPIVNTKDSVEKIFAESPLLFTTIIFVACRHHPRYSSLYIPLVSALNVLIAKFLAFPTTNAAEKNIQAILLLGSWQLPFERQNDDISWLRCGMVTNLALQYGFHRPGFGQEFRAGLLSRDEIQSRTITWLGCFLMDFSISGKLGLPATITPDFTIRSPPPGLPKKFKQHLQIAYTCSKFIPALSNSQFTPTGLIDASSRWSLLQLFDGELEALHAQLSQVIPLPTESEILLLTNRLHLQAYALQEDVQSVVGAPETSGVMITGFRTAIRLIDVVSSEKKKGLLKYYPSYPVRALVMASLWLLKLIAISVSHKSTHDSKALAEPENPVTAVALLDTKSIELALNHVRETFVLLQELSLSENDEPRRAAFFVESMVGTRGDGGPSSAAWWGHSIKIRSRMGSSLIYDAVTGKGAQVARARRLQAVSNITRNCTQQKDLQSDIVPPLPVPEDPWDYTELGIDPGFWGMIGDLDGFGSWDSWDNGFAFNPPLDC